MVAKCSYCAYPLEEYKGGGYCPRCETWHKLDKWRKLAQAIPSDRLISQDAWDKASILLVGMLGDLISTCHGGTCDDKCYACGVGMAKDKAREVIKLFMEVEK